MLLSDDEYYFTSPQSNRLVRFSEAYSWCLGRDTKSESLVQTFVKRSIVAGSSYAVLCTKVQDAGFQIFTFLEIVLLTGKEMRNLEIPEITFMLHPVVVL